MISLVSVRGVTDWESSTQATIRAVTVTIIMASDSRPVTELVLSARSQCKCPSRTRRGMSTEFRFTCHRTSPQGPPQWLSRVLKGYSVSKLEMNAPVSPDQLAGPMVNRWVSRHGEHRLDVGVWKMFRETTAS